MFGGGWAFATTDYLITSTHQIKPSVLTQLKGNRGPRGYRGYTGPRGPAGPSTGQIVKSGSFWTDDKHTVRASGVSYILGPTITAGDQVVIVMWNPAVRILNAGKGSGPEVQLAFRQDNEATPETTGPGGFIEPLTSPYSSTAFSDGTQMSIQPRKSISVGVAV